MSGDFSKHVKELRLGKIGGVFLEVPYI